MTATPMLLIGTRKGIWTMSDNASRTKWTLSEPHFLGHIAQHVVADPRPTASMLAAMRTGHLGPTVFRSTTTARRGPKRAARPRSRPATASTVR